MLEEFLENENFVSLMEEHVKNVIEILLSEGIEFSILTNVAQASFNPELPNQIKDGFKPIVSFVLAGYTFESAQIDEKNIQFEAGFGPDNIGSVVTIPLHSILQVIIEKTPILINLSIPKEKEETTNKSGIDKSMNAFLSNPENKDLIKK